jgi:uncharacterized protein (UPF0332 family)
MTPDRLREYTSSTMAKAERNLAEAESNLAAGSYNVAASQSYYAMFDAAKALLATRNLDVSRAADPEVVAMFAYHFVSTGNMPPKLRDYFQSAFKARIASGYDSRHNETAENAQDLVNKTGEFLAEANDRLEAEFKRLKLPRMRKTAPGEASSNV